MARRHTICLNPDKAPPLTGFHGPTARHYAICLNPERAHANLMSTGQDRLVPSFNNLPTELLIKIWQRVIGSHRVLQVTTRNQGRVVATSTLTRSTAAARAAVSVSRAHRALILEHILPNEITIWGYNSFRGCFYSPLCVVRYKAARDILYVSWPSNETQDAIHLWFSGLKELYNVCPTNEMLDTEDEDAEEANPQDAPSQEVSQDVSQETTLESFMEMESTERGM